MKHWNILKWIMALHLFVFATSCETNTEDVQPNFPISERSSTSTTSSLIVENFESGSKSNYSGASVDFASGSWYFDDALVGELPYDIKNGNKAARIRYNGSLTMEHDLTSGVKSISISYARYNSDKNSTFEIYYSTNSGSSWTQVGSQVTANKTTLSTASFTLNVQGQVRFQIRKTDGSSNRLNIDDVTVESNPLTDPMPGSGTTTNIKEDYETGSKGSYAGGSVVLLTGSWYLNEALIGTLASDRKIGTKSVRIRDSGSLTMEFDVNGAKSVSLSHAVFSSDGSSSWVLQASTNGGASWTTVGSTVTTSSTTLSTATFNVDYTGSVRFRVAKITGGSNRINIDDFVISGTSSSDGGDTGGGGTGGDTGSGSVHLTMGNPSGAVTDITLPNNYLLNKEEFVMSYSRDKGTANWVSWHLDEAWLGSTSRQNDFRADATLPPEWYHVNENDYRYSGFDRGHMCPSADRTLSVDDNSNTFLMTNMIPQAPNNNRIAWANLENYCRSMLNGGYEIYIISGGYGVGGTGSNGYATTIANGNVTVPANTWKVILIIPDGNDDVNRVTTSSRVIAVDMPNSQNVSSDWTLYKTTVDNIEAKTGYNLLDLIPDNIENVIESRIDNIQ